MQFTETLNIILAVIAVVSVVFSVFLYFKKPQDKLEKTQALQEQEIDSKANVLAQQLQRYKESTDAKFQEIICANKDSMALAQNHLHTVDTKLDNAVAQMNIMSNEITKLTTIINERIPKNK